MKLLLLCFTLVAVSTVGVILCDGIAKQAFEVGFFGSLGFSLVLLLIGHFN